jgi:hypothetical protein
VLGSVALALPGVELEIHECLDNAATALPQSATRIRIRNDKVDRQGNGAVSGGASDFDKAHFPATVWALMEIDSFASRSLTLAPRVVRSMSRPPSALHSSVETARRSAFAEATARQGSRIRQKLLGRWKFTS